MNEQNTEPMIEPRENDRLEWMAAQEAPATLPLGKSPDVRATASPTVETTANSAEKATLAPDAGNGGKTVEAADKNPEGEQTAMPLPTPVLGAQAPEREQTEQPVGEETPAGMGAEFDPTPSPTESWTESSLLTPDVTKPPEESKKSSCSVWGWLGSIALIGVIVFVVARMIFRRSSSSSTRHGHQRTGQRGKDGRSARGKSGKKPSIEKQEAYSPTVAMTIEEKRGKIMHNVNHVPIVQPSPYRVGYAQTIGNRPNQEDSYGASTSAAQIQEKGLLAVVADGIGGMEDGQVASGAVVRTMFSGYAEQSRKMAQADRLLRLAANAQSSVLSLNQSASSRCGSTVVSVLADGDQLSFLSIGDSRIYLYRGGALLQLNREHKFGSDHDENVALGYSDENIDARRRGALTSYIGRENMTQIDRNTQPLKLMHGDRILLMTDGVFGTLSADELVACLDVPVQSSAERMIAAVESKSKAHQDNATVVIVEYL